MRAMKVGDLGFFYHSNIGKEIVGIVEVCRESAPDSTTDDPRWDCVMIRAVRPLERPVTLEECKVEPGLEKMVLVNNSRLSVQPVTPEEWRDRLPDGRRRSLIAAKLAMHCRHEKWRAPTPTGPSIHPTCSLRTTRVLDRSWASCPDTPTMSARARSRKRGMRGS